MAIFELILILLGCVLISAVIDQFVPKISLPLIQIGLGVIIAIIAWGRFELTIDTELFMVLFIAPLLYSEASQASKISLARNRGAILSLAIGLVVAITLIVGYTLNWLVPSIQLSAAFALGAALAPTDAVAVTSLPDDVKLGRRRESILQGESLLNDASGIVSFQFAVAATVTGTFSLVDAGVKFLVLFFGGIALGVVLGLLCVFLLKKLRSLGLESTTFIVLFDVFLPFIVYSLGEALHVSGVIAVVCAGIVRAWKAKEISPGHSMINIVSTSVWEVLVFTINGIVFIMLGATLPNAFINSWTDATISNFHLIFYVVTITITLVLVRFLWLLAIEYIHNKKNFKSMFHRENVHSALLMTIGGAKGAVAMSIMFSIPLTIASGAPFPGRSMLLFIAGGVVLLTLVLTNFLLPILVPKSLRVHQKRVEAIEQDADATQIEVLRRVMEDLTAMQTKGNRHATQNVLEQYSARIESLKKKHGFDDDLNVKMRLKALLWERQYVCEQMKAGKVTPYVGYKYLNRISNMEDLLTHHTSLVWKLKGMYNKIVSFIKAMPRKTKNIATKNTVQPGETAQITTSDIMGNNDKPVSDIKTLQRATVSYVIKMLTEEIQNDSHPTEDVSNVLKEYRQIQAANMEKPASLTVVEVVEDKTREVAMKGLHLEMQYIIEEYKNRKITFEQYRHLYDQVLLMQVSMEDFSGE